MSRPKIITERELQVIRLSALRVNKIAELLGIKPSTVKTITQRACIKLGVRSRTQAMIKLLRLGLLQPNQFVIGYEKE